MRVCIIGAGLSSITLAKALVNQKIHVDLVAKKKDFLHNHTRTIGISKSNVEYFNKHIININKIIWKINEIEIFSENLKNEKILNFKDDKSQLFSIIKNFQLNKVITNSLSKSKFFQKKNINRKTILSDKYNLVINTDYFDEITKKFFYKKITKKYNSFAYTTIIKHKKIKNGIATQIFTSKGPIAFLPVSNYETSVVFSIQNSKNENDINIKNLISKYNLKYKIIKINKIHSFGLKSLNLRSYYYNNILSFGDLLHRIHPLAGQGFNMTIRDIKILIDIIKRKNNLGLPLDKSINSEFENNSKHKNLIFSNGIDFIYQFFDTERKFNNSFLSKTVQIFGKNKPINKLFTKIADKGINF